MERYGGNTSCVQVISSNGTLVVIDCGTGAHDLGRTLLAEAKGPLKGNILISHTHWDHIQGFPFFTPLFVPGGNWDIYGPSGLGRSLRDTLSGQMEHTYFPVTLDQMGANIFFHDLVEGHFEIDDIHITARYLNHPTLTLGYKLEVGGASVIYACDHEPHSRQLGQDGPLHELDQLHCDFLSGADLVIHDAHFTDKEYVAHKGWGHSPVEYVCELGYRAGVKQLAFTHHDPLRTDQAIDQIVEAARSDLKAKASPMHVFAAAEGMAIDLNSPAFTITESHDGSHSATRTSPALYDPSVLIGISEPKWSQVLAEAARAEGIRTVHATNTASALQSAKSTPPGLILLEDQPKGIDGLAICRDLRSSRDPRLVDVPIVMVSDREKISEGIDAGVTRWLISPFSTQYAKAVIHACLLRSNLRWKRAALPPDEKERLSALGKLSLLDTAPEERFDRITRLAVAIGDVPIASVTLVDQNRQWFKSCVGLGNSENSRELSFCAHAILGRSPLIVPDTLRDDRFADNPLVTGDPRIRFYAGFPIVYNGGSCVGTLCLIDTRPRHFPASILQRFEDLASLVQQELNVSPKNGNP